MRIVLAIALLLFAWPALAQQTPDEERSYFIGFVENQLSTPNRQFRIRNIQGVLSSNATIGEITIADRQGVWLRIVNARIVWTRSALLLGRLSIDTLAADSIDVLRQPLPEEGLPPPESSSFQVPELPLSVRIGALEVSRASFGPTVFGLASQVSLTGRLTLEGGSLDTQLDVTRLDGPGGRLALAAAYANATRVLHLDLSLSEPANGVVANLTGIEGKPPIALTLRGQGPLDTLQLALTFDADAQRVLTGTTRLNRQAEGLAFDADLHGPIARLVAPRLREFFGAETTLAADGVVKDAGGLDLTRLELSSGALALSAAAGTTTDGFLERLTLDARIADPSGQRVLLPAAGNNTISRAELNLSYGQAGKDDWSGLFDIAGLETGDFAAASVKLALGGLARNIQQADRRSLTFKADGSVSGMEARRPEIKEALGEEITLAVEGEWNAGEPVRLAKAELAGNGLSASLAGDIADYVFSGRIGLDAANIAPFSGLAGRDLSGSVNLAAQGTVSPIGGGFDLTLDGTAEDLGLGLDAADRLLQGQTKLSGRVARGEQGLQAEKFRIGNDQVAITADGTFATGAADFGFDVALKDLALVSDRAAGALTAKGRAAGSGGRIALTFDAAVPAGTLAGKRLTEAGLRFRGNLADGDLSGNVAGNGFLDGVRVQLGSAVATFGQTRQLSNLTFTAGGTRLQGGRLAMDAAGLIDGNLSLASPDISTAAALALVEASGAADLRLDFSRAGARQRLAVNGNLRNLVAGTVRVGSAEIGGVVNDLFGVPAIEGRLRAQDAIAGGVEIGNIDGTARTAGDATNFEINATLKNRTEAGIAGSLAPVEGGYRVGLTTATLRQGQLQARLAKPASVTIRGSDLAIDGVALDVGGGGVDIAGAVAEKLDLTVGIRALPLAIANAIRPNLALGGTLEGSAKVGGTRTQPDVSFTLKGRQIAAAALRAAGLSTLAVDGSGSSTAERLTVDATIASPEGLRASVKGGVPLTGGQLALDVDLDAFPLAVLNAVAPGQNLGGSLTGSARVGGALAAPTATFRINGSGIRAAPLDAAGLSPLQAEAAGSFASNAVTLASASASGPAGLSITGNGRIPLRGSGLAVTLNGEAPLALANRMLAERGAQASGTLNLGVSVTGSLDRPSIRGMFSTQGATLVDPGSNVRLTGIAVMGAIDGETVTIRNASAQIAGGGSVAAQGTVSTGPGLPADLRVTLTNARYADGSLVVATVSGALALTGQLQRDPLLSGAINVDRAEITVPSSFGGSAAALGVRHVKPPRAVAETLRRARANDGTPTPTARPSVVRLDVTVNAPNQIFIRGRGLDAEIGGSVRLTGPVTSVQPVGAFRLIRGRLGILGQRITFNEGTVTLVGDLDPFLNFVARSQGNDITVFVTVTGRVSNLDIKFSSQPELPQDEVLARLIFNRSIGELSAFQIAQLAAAAAELAGGSNNSLIGSLRSATGLDDLDVVTDSQGNAALRAGRYIQDNVYLGVEAGAKGATRGTINLDITDELKAKGSVGSDGDSSLGVFFERDY